MPSDYGWLGIGGSFHERDGMARTERFMHNAVAVAEHLDAVDPTAWRAATGLRSIYLVLVHEPGAVSPDIDVVSEEDGVRTFSVTYDWLGDDFLDADRGPWEVLARLVLSLSSISSGTGVPLPQLSARTA